MTGNTVRIGDRLVGDAHPTYFIADIAANHDGSLERAKMLVERAAKAGADAAKFQNFRAAKIVSDVGFRALGTQQSHQADWQKSVFEVYADASIPFDWTPILADTCRAAGIDYFTAPYDVGAVDELTPYMPAIKIGSGDITWLEIIRHIGSKGKPVLLATGAANIGDVQRAVDALRETAREIVLMQCNTNYTGSLENLRHVNLNVLRTYAQMFPDLVLGLSDHTPGHATVLGAVALGARAVEKHFTDDTTRSGPDHGFSMDPVSWRTMVDRTRELEAALGSPEKAVAQNERQTVVLQRRCVRAARPIAAGEVLGREDLDVLRPAPANAIPPYDIERLIGARTLVDVAAGEELTWLKVGA
jgi:N-acetylneuraminate synthase